MPVHALRLRGGARTGQPGVSKRTGRPRQLKGSPKRRRKGESEGKKVRRKGKVDYRTRRKSKKSASSKGDDYVPRSQDENSNMEESESSVQFFDGREEETLKKDAQQAQTQGSSSEEDDGRKVFEVRAFISLTPCLNPLTSRINNRRTPRSEERLRPTATSPTGMAFSSAILSQRTTPSQLAS
eukprot:2151947-Rhodomonas_salina.3